MELRGFVNAWLALETEQRPPRLLFVVSCENVSVSLFPMFRHVRNIVGLSK